MEKPERGAGTRCHPCHFSDTCRDGQSRTKGRAPSFGWDFGRVSRTPLALLLVSAAGGPGTSHNPCTLPRSAFATSDQPHTAGALGGGCPGYRAALRLT